jgi:hypothetical protein
MYRLRCALYTLFLATLLGACQSEPSPRSTARDSAARADSLSADAVLERAIAAHGGDVLDRAVVSFRFRGDRYRLRQDDGRFRFQRTYADSTGRTVREVLSNDSLYRAVDGERVALSDDERQTVETTVNSVSYFALLPHPLGDPAVQARYSALETIDGADYHRIRVTFQQEGGGRDWEDVFLYWFRTDTYAMDFLSYAFGLAPGETDRGTRFREAYNVRTIEGVRVADYRNYTRDALPVDQMERYPQLWMQDSLRLVSTIELDSVTVRPLP